MYKKSWFGELLKSHRLQCRDPKSGKILTQARLSELLAEETGISYTSANISSWERGNSRIDQDDRAILIGLVKVLHDYGGISTLAAANEILEAGNYRSINEKEMRQVDTSWSMSSQLPTTVTDVTLKSIDLVNQSQVKLPCETIPSRGPLPIGSLMPLSINPIFVGRQNILQLLAQEINGMSDIGLSPTIVASGFIGVGKSQVIVEFVYRYGRYFTGGIFWLQFHDPKTIPEQIALCGSRDGMSLGVDFEELGLKEQVKTVQRAWREPIPRLLIFDGCEDELLLAKWRPPYGGCYILVTSRCSRWDLTIGVKLIKIQTLTRTESVALLTKFRADMTETEAAAIAASLGDLPLALHLAGRFLYHYSDMLISNYVAELNELHGYQLLDHPSLHRWDNTYSPTNYRQDIISTFRLSYNRLTQDNNIDSLARLLLARAACFDPYEPIPKKLLLATLDLHTEITSLNKQKLITQELFVESALIRLISLGLIEEGSEKVVVQLNRLLSEFVKATIPDPTALSSVETVVLSETQRLNKAQEPALLRPWQAHLHHIVTAAQQRFDERAARLSYALGYYLKLIADYDQAYLYLTWALSVFKKIFKPNHPDLVLCLMTIRDVQDQKKRE